MGAGSQAAGSGVVIGIAAVLLGQQLGFVDLSGLGTSLFDFIVAGVVGAVMFGVIGRVLGYRYVKKHTPVAEWSSVPPGAYESPPPPPELPPELPPDLPPDFRTEPPP